MEEVSAAAANAKGGVPCRAVLCVEVGFVEAGWGVAGRGGVCGGAGWDEAGWGEAGRAGPKRAGVR